MKNDEELYTMYGRRFIALPKSKVWKKSLFPWTLSDSNTKTKGQTEAKKCSLPNDVLINSLTVKEDVIDENGESRSSSRCSSSDLSEVSSIYDEQEFDMHKTKVSVTNSITDSISLQTDNGDLIACTVVKDSN